MAWGVTFCLSYFTLKPRLPGFISTISTPSKLERAARARVMQPRHGLALVNSKVAMAIDSTASGATVFISSAGASQHSFVQSDPQPSVLLHAPSGSARASSRKADFFIADVSCEVEIRNGRRTFRRFGGFVRPLWRNRTFVGGKTSWTGASEGRDPFWDSDRWPRPGLGPLGPLGRSLEPLPATEFGRWAHAVTAPSA